MPSGRTVVAPESDLEERVIIALMAALAPGADHRSRIANGAVHRDEEPGTFETFGPDWFYYLERVADGRFALIASDE
jgi:hypothetical protein